MMDLNKIFEMLNSEDYKERFRGEAAFLKMKGDKLQQMLKKHKEGTLEFQPDCPMEILSDQLDVMTIYFSILMERAIIEGIDLSDIAPKENNE